MNKTIIFVLTVLAISLLIVGCGAKSVDNNSLEAESEENKQEELSEAAKEMKKELEQMKVNTESSEVQRQQSKEVVIENGRFNPVDITVKVGDTVEWINTDSVAHTVSFEDARFDVEVPSGAAVTYTFEEGDFESEARYFCKFHPNMRGSVLVE